MTSKYSFDGIGILIFSLLLYSGMWVSKTVHPLWFDQNQALENFGISYAAMAAAGASSFLLGKLISKVPLRLAMFIGCALYTIGLGLRIFPSLPLAILSGVISGIGASTSLICLSSWPFEHEEERNRNRLFSYSLLSSNLARGVVVTATGLLFFGPSFTESSLQMLLLVSAMMPIAAFFLLYQAIPTFKAPPRRTGATHPPDQTSANQTLYMLAIYSLVSGLTVSFVLPYLPILLTKQGLSEGTTVTTLGLCSVIVVLTQPILLQLVARNNMRMVFSVSIAILAISTALLAWDGWIVIFIIWVGIRFVAANSVMYAQRTLEMQLIHKDMAQNGMGTLQSAFLFGDMLGGGVSGFLWATGFDAAIFPALAALILANGAFFFWLTGRSSQEHSLT